MNPVSHPAAAPPPAFASPIVPNMHSRGTVKPHCIEEFARREPGLAIVASKSAAGRGRSVDAFA